MSCLLETKGPDKECCAAAENYYENSGGTKMRRKEMVHPAKLPETLKLEFLLVERCMHHQKDRVRPNMSRGRELAKDNLKTNPITIKSKRVSHIAEQFSWVPLPCCSPPCSPFPKKLLALSACVSPGTIHFSVLDKSPLSDPARSPPFCNRWRLWWDFLTATDAVTIQVLRDKLVH